MVAVPMLVGAGGKSGRAGAALAVTGAVPVVAGADDVATTTGRL
jgi:hypothetical protein